MHFGASKGKAFKLDDNPVDMARPTAAIGFPTVSCVFASSGKQQISHFCSKVLVAVGDCRTSGGEVSKVNKRVWMAGNTRTAVPNKRKRPIPNSLLVLSVFVVVESIMS